MSDQQQHAASVGHATGEVTKAAINFARTAHPALSGADVGRIFACAGVTLMMGAEGPAGAAALLRELASALEAVQAKSN